MELNLFKNNKNESHDIVGDFIKELNSFLTKNSAQENQTVQTIVEKQDENEELTVENSESQSLDSENVETNLKLDNNHKENHLYLVTSDRNNQIYLWDFTDKPEYEFEEKNIPPELLDVAKEGAMLQFKNGTFTLYSELGYDMLFDEENK